MIQKKSISYLLSFIFAVLLCLPAITYAMPGGGSMCQNGKQCPMKLFFYSFFNITLEQQAQLESLKQATHDKIKPYSTQMESLHKQLEETLLASEIDTDNASKIIKAVGALEAQIIPIKANARIDAAQILTPEQRVDIQGAMTDVTSFIDYIMAYPGLDDLWAKYGDRLLRANIDTRLGFLNLTEEQKTALVALQNKTGDEIKAIAEEIKPLRQDIAAAILATTIDTAKASSLIDQLIGPTVEMSTARMNAKVEAAQILTAEQRKLVLDKITTFENTHKGSGVRGM